MSRDNNLISHLKYLIWMSMESQISVTSSSVSQFIDMWKYNQIKLILLHNDDHNTLYSLETIKYLSVDKLFLHIIRR